MSKILNLTAVISLGVWIVGFFIYDLGFYIHLFLVLASIAFIVKVLLEK
ncbi:lmo0937 family membrane protein [Maribacter chungangensis]|uniref:Lmo0937 family membrane protein n=1 Tax=Maribacter chungangensis TaxID=1069117 RepID=A0ABW3B6R2_9FLAO